MSMLKPTMYESPRFRCRLSGALAAVLTGAPAVAWGAEGKPEAAANESVLSVIGAYLSDGGPVMYAILLVSVIGTALFLERVWDLHLRRRLSSESFIGELVRLSESRQFDAAIAFCNIASNHPLVRVVRAGLLRANQREKEIERAMENEMLRALPDLSKRIGMIALLANAATLVGLLGTIFGLIAAFNSVSLASAAERQTALAAGISQAMYTTAFGISVALPLLFFHHFASKRMDRIVMEVESGAQAILVALAGRKE